MSAGAPLECSFSIVSHGHGSFIRKLLEDFRLIGWDSSRYEILLTINVPEDLGYTDGFSDLPIRVNRNPTPKGFGANHNAAFRLSRARYFVIVNPDIRLGGTRIESLLEVMEQAGVGACAPQVMSSTGEVQDSARRFPTLGRLIWRLLTGRRGQDYPASNAPMDVDWVAGMFVVFHRPAYEAIAGFDERYFMYLEDADICRRLHRAGWRVLLQPGTSVVHDAQRASRRDPVHFRWHLRSMLRYLSGL